MIMRNQQNNVKSFELLIGMMAGQSEIINDCQTTRGSIIMGRQGILNQKCTNKGNKKTPHSIKTKMVEQRGGKDDISESRDGNNGRKTEDRGGGRHNNRWQEIYMPYFFIFIFCNLRWYSFFLYYFKSKQYIFVVASTRPPRETKFLSHLKFLIADQK